MIGGFASDARSQARGYAKQALPWLVDGGIAASVSVGALWLTKTAIGISVTATEPQQIAGKVFRFSWHGKHRLRAFLPAPQESRL